MFLCNSSTERDCLGRMLFGSPMSKWSEVSKITTRTAIFLYTLGQYPKVRGIFVAQKPPFLDNNGPFKGKFPAQVRVSWYHEFRPVPSGWFEFDRFFGDDGNRERKLSKSQTRGMISCFIDNIWRTEIMARFLPVQNRVTPNRCESRKIVKPRRPVQPKPKLKQSVIPMRNFLLFNGRPIPVYNPKGVHPLIHVLPSPQQGVRPGFNIPVFRYLRQPQIIMSPVYCFQKSPIQVQKLTRMSKTFGTPFTQRRVGKKNVRSKT